MIVALPMYDLLEISAATDAFWAGLRSHLVEAGVTGLPMERRKTDDLYAHWLDRGLSLSQTCGYPLTHGLKGRVRYLATPSYVAEGCGAATYRSFVIVRTGDDIARGRDLAGRIAAFNGPDSQSGYNILRHYLAHAGVAPGSLADTVESGRHRRSVSMVKAGMADFCSIDCVTWALLQAHAPKEVEGLRVLDQTASAPCLPFITSLETPVENLSCLRTGLNTACNDPDLDESRKTLLLKNISVLDEDIYDVILTQEQEAAAAGWSKLA